MLKPLILAMALIAGQHVGTSPNDLPDSVRMYIEAAREYRLKRIEALKTELPRLEEELKLAQTGRIVRGLDGPAAQRQELSEERARWLFKTREAKQQTIAQLQKPLDEARSEREQLEINRPPIAPPLHGGRLNRGQAGTFASLGPNGQLLDRWFIVKSIIDGDSVLAAMLIDEPHYSSNGSFVYFKRREGDRWYWIDGVSTANMVDGSRIDAEKMIFAIMGTRQYDGSDGGVKTVYVLEAVPIERFRAQVDLALGIGSVD